MPSNYVKDDPIFGQVDLDNYFITDADLIDRYVGNGMWAWGVNSSGALGLRDQISRSSPVQVGSLTNWKMVSCVSSTAAITTNGALWTWGANYGQLGQNNTTNISSPVQVGSLTNWKQVSCGRSSGSFGEMCAIKTDGTLWTWGKNTVGGLGLNDTTNRSSPVQVGILTNWKQVSCSDDHTAAIKTDGTLWTWGYNYLGQLGLGNLTHRSSPVQVGSLTNWKQVTIFGNRTAAIKTDGTLWTWGYNYLGKLGLNDVTSRSSPTQVGSLTNWKLVACGLYHTAAIKTDGTLWTWGSQLDLFESSSSGALGLNDLTNRSSPTQVGSLTNWKLVECGLSHTAAIKTDGTLWTWGFNKYGTLGLGNVVNRSSPTQVGSLTNWKMVAVGGLNILAITYADIT
jgi:alpha-tubulin suppressor-like RCC1 family protein